MDADFDEFYFRLWNMVQSINTSQKLAVWEENKNWNMRTLLCISLNLTKNKQSQTKTEEVIFPVSQMRALSELHNGQS